MIETPVAPAAIDASWTHTALLHILGYALLAGLMTTGVAFVYRKATVRPIPVGTAVLAGVSFPALLLSIEWLFRDTVILGSSLDHYSTGAYIVGVFVTGTTTAEAGRRIGDHLACGVFEITAVDARGEVADLVRAAGLSVAVTLPETIEDAEGYRPVDDDVKRALAERTLLFPQRLSVDELAARLRTRLERDYGVGHVHVDVAADGSVERLALGALRSGISSALPPGRAVVAVRGDSPENASVGDPLEVWRSSERSRELVATGTYRSSRGDVTSILVDEDDVDAFEAAETYRLLTHPDTPDDSNELRATVRRTAETVTKVAVTDSSPLEGEFVGWIPGTVLVVQREDEVLALPDDKETLAGGDTAYVFGTPPQLRAVASYEPESA